MFVVSSPQSSHSPYPLTGQQLMMQLDQVTSRMGDLTTQSRMDLTTQKSRMEITTRQSRDTHMDTQDTQQQQQQNKSQAGLVLFDILNRDVNCPFLGR